MVRSSGDRVCDWVSDPAIAVNCFHLQHLVRIVIVITIVIILCVLMVIIVIDRLTCARLRNMMMGFTLFPCVAFVPMKYLLTVLTTCLD